MRRVNIFLLLQLCCLGVFALGFAQIRVTTDPRDQAETSITANPKNPANLVAGSNDRSQGVFPGDPRAAYYYSADGGKSWPTKGLLSLPSGFTFQGDPSVAFDTSGNVFYGTVAWKKNANKKDVEGSIFVYKSSTGGSTWGSIPTAVVSYLNNQLILADKPYLTVDAVSTNYRDRIYISWTTFYNHFVGNEPINDSTKIHFTYSTDHGATFFTPHKVLATEYNVAPPDSDATKYYMLPTTSIRSPFSNNDPYVQFSIPAVGPDGSVYVAWWRVLHPDTVNIEIVKSIDGGNTFTAPKIIAKVRPLFSDIRRFRRTPYPVVTSDPNNATRVFVTWASRAADAYGTETIYFSRSTNGGTTWSAPLPVNTGAFQYAFHPWMTIDPTGRIYVAFRKGSASLNIYYSESLDNGQSFGSNILISDSSSFANNGNAVIDYDGATSTVGTFHPMWTDQRRSNEDIYTARVNRAPTSNSATATADNGQRKLARESNGTYHLAFETNQEIWYARKTTTDTEWNNYQRLSSGMAGGNSSPCIAERSGNIYVVWQQLSGSSYSVYFHKSTDGGTTWPSGNRQTLSSGLGSNPPLPVIIAPAAEALTVVHRTSLNLRYKVSNNNGSSWTSGAVPSTGTNDNSPTLAPTTTYWGSSRSALVYANTASVIYYRYYKNGPDSTGWNASAKNLSQIAPSGYNSHQKPSIAPSGTSGDKRLHVVWEARSGTTGNYYVIIHRKATDWYTWPNVYSATYYEYQQQPSITGLHDATAELLFKYYTQSAIYKMHYDGTYWGAPILVANGTNPSVSVGNTTAKYVWTDGYAAPYQIKTSTETLSKANAGPLAVAYHRSTAVIDTTAGAWFEVRINHISVKTKTGKESLIPLATAQEDSLTLTPSKAFDNLSSTPVVLPTDADSLLVNYWNSGSSLSAIKNASDPLSVEIIVTSKSGNTIRMTALSAASENLPETKLLLTTPISAFAGEEISVRRQVTGVATKSSILASLGHIYEIVEGSSLEMLSKNAETVIPEKFSLAIYPNPFNPTTHIQFTLPAEDIVTLRIYNLHGQLVRELLHGYRPAGKHTIPWDGRDERGIAAASGIYFIHLQTGWEAKISKLTLMK